MSDDRGWASASDLEEYAYCPRAHYYRRHPPASGRSPASATLADGGRRYHQRTLGAEARRDARGSVYLVALLAGAAITVAGVAWLLYR